MDLLFVKRHNVCAFLVANDPKSAEFVPVLNFLANSSISFAISHNLPVFEHIRATVREQEVLFSEAKIRQVLMFNDNPEALIDFPSFYIKECFRRMGHPDEFKSGQIIKNSLPPHWRYFVHIFIHCLSIRKGGFDSANAMVASAILGTIKGRDYNFSGLVFIQLKENLTGVVKEKFLVYPRFLQIIINHFHPDLQQGGNILVFDHMRAKTLSYMKRKNKRTNRVIADIPLFGHVIGKEEEFVPDFDPDLPVQEELLSSEEEEVEVEQDQETSKRLRLMLRLRLKCLMYKKKNNLMMSLFNVEAGAQEGEEEISESSGTLDARIYGPADTYSDYELEEPKAKRIKTGFEDVSSSSDSSIDTPLPTPPPSPQPTPQPTPLPSPQQAHIPTPPPSPQHVPIPTPPTSPSHEPTSSVPRVKTLSLEVKKLLDNVKEKESLIESLRTELDECKEEFNDLKLEFGGLHTRLDVQQTQLEAQEKLISQQQQDFKALSDIVEQLKASMVKTSEQATASTAQGETTFSSGPSSPTFVTNPESAMTIFSSPAAKIKEAVEVKVEEQEFDLPSASERKEARKRGKGTITEVETVILDEEDVASDDMLNVLLDEIDNFGYNELYPDILPTEERETERTRYFTEEGDESKALSDEDKTEDDVRVNIVKPVVPDEPTPIIPEATQFQLDELDVLFTNHTQSYCDDDEADAKAYQRVVS
ncbi:hypothetical protein L1987_63735 [Smallanthus sonchifolius]|uniref:Uncharacterized protein n=1 Tax=Smallanthus sonchifolius TaxID=185202 RepID=A0ACB9CEB2_9ASTR|nr:hypothetical protein L1987_63735 [Smallanthus sonchifolius]